MPSIRILQFGGIRPAVEPRLLPLQYSQVAFNTELRRGSLCSYRQPSRIRGTSDDSLLLPPSSVNGGQVMSETDACLAPAYRHCSGSDDVAIFFRDGRPPVIVEADGDRHPLVPIAPTQAAVATVVSQGGGSDYIGPDARTYTYTWVMEDGTESRPAPASAPVTVYEPATVELQLQPPPARAIAVRIYRTDSPIETMHGSDDNLPRPTFQLVRDVEPAVASWTDSVRMRAVENGGLVTADHCDPVDMDCVQQTEAGYLVGFNGQTVRFSEIGEPHNWPGRYIVELPFRVVGIAVHQDSVYVGTTGHPFRIDISQPQGDEEFMRWTVHRYDAQLPLEHRGAITATDTGAAMATIGGIAHLDRQPVARLRTRNRVDEDVWDDEVAPTHLVWHHERLFGWGGPIGGFVFGWQGSDNLDIGDFVTIDFSPVTAHAGADGRLYFIDDGAIWTWDTGADPLPYRWRSRIYRAHGWMKWAAAKVVGDQTAGAPVTFRLYGDGVLYWEREVANDRPFRLPCGHRAIEWEIELEGSTCVREVHVATSIQELTESGGNDQ